MPLYWRIGTQTMNMIFFFFNGKVSQDSCGLIGFTYSNYICWSANIEVLRNCLIWVLPKIAKIGTEGIISLTSVYCYTSQFCLKVLMERKFYEHLYQHMPGQVSLSHTFSASSTITKDSVTQLGSGKVDDLAHQLHSLTSNHKAS